MMTALIIYCHPYEKSFNHAVLKAIQKNLTVSKVDYQIIDLYAEEFDPVYSKTELSLYHTGATVDPLVERYLALLKKAKTVIIVTPIWWNSIPGMLKGFIDKVMKEGMDRSHTVTKLGVHGRLTNVKHCYVLTTSASPTFYIRFFNGNAIKKIFIDRTLKQLGFKKCYWQNLGMISNSSDDSRKQYLRKIEQQAFK